MPVLNGRQLMGVISFYGSRPRRSSTRQDFENRITPEPTSAALATAEDGAPPR